jgi:ATP-dependent Lhr-like helicase
MQVAEDDALWLPIEHLSCLRAIYPDAVYEPHLHAPDGLPDTWAPENAVVEIVRARLSATGPSTVAAIARPLTLPASTVAAALVTLEGEGYAMRGRFTPGAAQEEWCERHLLARIHRYTIRRLRREIEPVERADFMRFLFEWQRVAPEARGMGRDALATTIAQLEGFEAAAAAWEEEILPARIRDYTGMSLDELCRSGKLVWARLVDGNHGSSSPVRATPIALLPRRELPTWHSLTSTPSADTLSARARGVFDALTRHGAMFFDELLHETRMLPIELETALGELVAAGLANADSFAGLRALLKPAAARQRTARGSSRRGRHFAQHGAFIGGMDDAGRWALMRRMPGHDSHDTEKHVRANSADMRAQAVSAAPRSLAASAMPPELLEHVAMTLLRRYGVVCWQLLEREASWLPRWRELLRTLQRLEARGQARGGRFISGLSGEQFALPEAIAVLRETRKRRGDGQMVCVSGADPLNLVGTVLPGDKVPALAGNRILFRDGAAIAKLVSGKFEYSPELGPNEREIARLQLARAHASEAAALSGRSRSQ